MAGILMREAQIRQYLDLLNLIAGRLRRRQGSGVGTDCVWVVARLHMDHPQHLQRFRAHRGFAQALSQSNGLLRRSKTRICVPAIEPIPRDEQQAHHSVNADRLVGQRRQRVGGHLEECPSLLRYRSLP